ncbi:urease accessory protein D [Argentina anserina]|uniref:urease accessory protein D n=1 Tax=Argentina anserina TaxID=57926 RepID=UPI0021765966|nr:urease accessory protein D [Potentilla anserina]XP_050371670.1 urease accessory protein D [Potentilla anserina]XP_050371671.1 urease accessory protein D [Potentilla anserina]
MEKQGRLVVEKVGGRSTVTRSFSKYPLKFIVPRKVGSSKADAVWVYTLTYGGGIVTGDSISCEFTIGDGCTTVITTQASTKVYKSLGAKCSEQVMEARVGSNALLAVIPDPVTCFSTARYSQKQIFRVVADSSLVFVDWITSGRHESGEKWDFDLYKSANHIFIGDDEPLFLDMVHLESGSVSSIAERMQDYQVIAMVVLLGPKIKHIQDLVQENVKRMMAERLHNHSTASSGHQKQTNSHCHFTKPGFIASSSIFGPKGIGVVVRIAATTTESVYEFLQHQLAGMEPLLGVSPYR